MSFIDRGLNFIEGVITFSVFITFIIYRIIIFCEKPHIQNKEKRFIKSLNRIIIEKYILNIVRNLLFFFFSLYFSIRFTLLIL